MPLRCLMLVTICVVFITTEAVSGENVQKIVGDEVSFRPTNINASVVGIIWKHRNSSGVVVKVIEWDDDGINIPNQRFQGITIVDEKTGQMTITKLTVQHSGVYTIDVNSREQEQRFSLIVMERVPKPVIKIRKINDNPNVKNVICEYSEIIIWRNSTGKILIGSKHHSKGEFITAEFTGNHDNTCTLNNSVSTETSDPVYERDLFQDLRGYVIVSVGMVFIILFLFIPPCHEMTFVNRERVTDAATCHPVLLIMDPFVPSNTKPHPDLLDPFAWSSALNPSFTKATGALNHLCLHNFDVFACFSLTRCLLGHADGVYPPVLNI